MVNSKTIFQRRKIMLPNIREYTENTTIHGIKYLGEKRRPVGEKCFWIIIFIFCFSILGYLIHDLVEKWQQRSVILVEDVEPTPIFEIPFPAVTICPQFKIKPKDFEYAKFREMVRNKSFAEPNYMMKFELAQQLCAYENVKKYRRRYASRFNFTYLTQSHIDLLHEITPDINDVMYFAKFQNEFLVRHHETNTLFSPILTNEGVCYTFNLPTEIIRKENLQTDYVYYNIAHTIKGWDYETGYFNFPSFPRILWASGVPNSLSCKLFAPQSDLYTQCQPTNLGYKIVLHSPAVYPSTFLNYILLYHETVTKIRVTPKIITTSPQLRSYTPHQRQCYFNDERRLQFYKFYNRANCQLECYANYTLAQFNCVHYAFPRMTGIEICGSNIDFVQIQTTGQNIKSFQDFIKKFPNEVNNSGGIHDLKFFCDCLPECNSIEYEYTTEAENFDHDKIVNSSTLVAPATFNIYWGETSIKGYTRKQLYTFVDLISNFGGLLGLFIGASILSVFEILYFCVIRQFSKCVNANGLGKDENVERRIY